MNKFLIFIILLSNILLAEDINTLLNEFELNTDKSLKTVDERLGHVSIYSQKDLKSMQYTTISDLLKELPLSSLNKNRFGISNLSLPGTKTSVSGFFRLFINNHEVTSNYSQSPSDSWMELPVDLIDYVEVYRGNSSFSLGSESGIFFIRVYTKNPSKENGSQLTTTVSSHGSNSQSIMNSDSFENGWSYLAYINNTKTKDSQTYKNNNLQNDSDRKYFYLNVKKDNTDINIGYTDSRKDNYLGYSMDNSPDSGEISSKDYFIDFSTYFLDDKSIKIALSYDMNELRYDESNSAGLGVVSVLDFSSLGTTIPKTYSQNTKVSKLNALASKKITLGDNNLLVGVNFQDKRYSKSDFTSVNFANNLTHTGRLNNFDKEQIFSLILQDTFKLNDDLLFLFNAKFDKHKRTGFVDDFSDEQYRVGAIYTPTESIGIKAFYTKTSIAPSFYNIDFALSTNTNMKEQKYKYFSIEGVYANNNSRFSIVYSNTKIKDFIYFTPAGFINVDDIVQSKSLMFDYTYEFSKHNKIQLNYYTTNLSEEYSNSNRGGYIKFMGNYDSFEYFSSVIYRNSFGYYTYASVDDSYNFNLGVTYNISKNLSLALKGENLFDDSTESIYQEGIAGDYFALKDYQREITFSLKWMF